LPPPAMAIEMALVIVPAVAKPGSIRPFLALISLRLGVDGKKTVKAATSSINFFHSREFHLLLLLYPSFLNYIFVDLNHINE
jgi:hypothetical protein